MPMMQANYTKMPVVHVRKIHPHSRLPLNSCFPRLSTYLTSRWLEIAPSVIFYSEKDALSSVWLGYVPMAKVELDYWVGAVHLRFYRQSGTRFSKNRVVIRSYKSMPPTRQMLLFTFTPDFPAEYREILYLADQLPYFSTFAGFPTVQKQFLWARKCLYLCSIRFPPYCIQPTLYEPWPWRHVLAYFRN